jgi:hypothetical protein
MLDFEWKYFWGTIDKSKFFHFAWFKIANKEFSHLSINGVLYESREWKCDGYSIDTPFLSFLLKSYCPDCINVLSKTNLHTSNPFLSGFGTINGKQVVIDAWYDYEKGTKVNIGNWIWTSIKLNNSDTAIFTYKKWNNSGAWVIAKEKSRKISYDILKDFSFIPIEKEVVFHPKYGRPYSEQPQIIMKGDNVVGIGMIERTHGWDFKNIKRLLKHFLRN